MRTHIRQCKLIAPVVLVMLVPAMRYPAYAAGPAVLARESSVVAAGVPPAPLNAGTRSGGNIHAQTPVPTPTAVHAAAVSIGPIATAPVVVCTVCVLHASILAPGTYPNQVTASSVTINWYDRSNNELGFKVYRRDLAGAWQVAYQVPTRDMAGGGDYSWMDTGTNLSGQCYKISAYNNSVSADTAEYCTVRPDPSRFPQNVASAAPQWSGLSSTNDGTGELVDGAWSSNLQYGEQTWGVNLTWGSSSLWRVEAQGGPHLMRGQAVALRVWGGGWLKYGTQTFGVDLQLSDTPVYEWYAIGQLNDPSEQTYAGTGLTNGGSFALWNSSAHAFLVRGYELWGIDLSWYRPDGASSPTPTPAPTHGVKTERLFNCAIDQQPVEVFIADQTVGGAFVDEGSLGEQYGSAGCPDAGSVPLTFSPQPGHQYLLVATDSSLPACEGNDPQESACRKMTAVFVGDANGVTRTDIVDIGTQITP